MASRSQRNKTKQNKQVRERYYRIVTHTNKNTKTHGPSGYKTVRSHWQTRTRVQVEFRGLAESRPLQVRPLFFEPYRTKLVLVGGTIPTSWDLRARGPSKHHPNTHGWTIQTPSKHPVTSSDHPNSGPADLHSLRVRHVPYGSCGWNDPGPSPIWADPREVKSVK